MNWTCLLGHARTWHRGSTNADGVTPKLCDHCLQPIGVLLDGEMIATPLKQAIAGTPTGKAKRVVKDNIAPWKVSSR